MGGYAVKGTHIQLSNLASTQKACLNATDLPQKFIQALGQATTYDVSKKELKFLDANQHTVLEFKNVK